MTVSSIGACWPHPEPGPSPHRACRRDNKKRPLKTQVRLTRVFKTGQDKPCPQQPC